LSCNEIFDVIFSSHKDQNGNLKADAEHQQLREDKQKELDRLEKQFQELKDKE
jgi:hypothetical protein